MNMLFACVCVFVFSTLPGEIVGGGYKARRAAAAAAATKLGAWKTLVTTVSSTLASVDKVWLLSSSLVSFTLSFFLTQSYAFWRSVYTLTRRVQGRLNDIGLLCAAAQARRRGRYRMRSFTRRSSPRPPFRCCSQLVHVKICHPANASRAQRTRQTQGAEVVR